MVQLDPGRRARGSAWNHTCTAREEVSAHLHESSHQTPMEHAASQMKSVGRGVAGKDCTHDYQDISTHLQASSVQDTKDFEPDPVCQGSEGGGERDTSF